MINRKTSKGQSLEITLNDSAKPVTTVDGVAVPYTHGHKIEAITTNTSHRKYGFAKVAKAAGFTHWIGCTIAISEKEAAELNAAIKAHPYTASLMADAEQQRNNYENGVEGQYQAHREMMDRTMTAGENVKADNWSDNSGYQKGDK